MKELNVDWTKALQATKKLTKRSNGSFNDSMISAYAYAKALKKVMYVFGGNSYMNRVFIVTEKLSNALCNINNNFNFYIEVTPKGECYRVEK